MLFLSVLVSKECPCKHPASYDPGCWLRGRRKGIFGTENKKS